MKTRIYFTCLILLISQFCQSAPIVIHNYNLGDWKKIIKKNDKPTIIHFWGISCSPCLEELPQWGKFVKTHKEINFVFVEVDSAPKSVISQFLSKSNLETVNNWQVDKSFDDEMRYEIDTHWSGELPMTIIVKNSEKNIKLLGPVDFTLMTHQFNKKN
jgi:thiol-disulfide isomerase/thioredoxin